MPLKRAVTTKVKILDVQVVSMPEDPAAVEAQAVKIVVKADMPVDQVPAEDLGVPAVKIEAKVVKVVKAAKDLVNVVMRIAKQAFTTVADLLVPINLVQVKDLVKKALVKAHLEVVQAKIGGLVVNQLPNLARNSRKAN
jgi:hypothetical protein